MDTYNQITDENLQNLGLQAGAALEDLLESPDKEVADGGADQGTVGGHLGDAGSEVVAVLVAVLREPRGDELLSTGEGTGSQHLGAQRVVLELLDVGLSQMLVSFRRSASAIRGVGYDMRSRRVHICRGNDGDDAMWKNWG